MDTYLLPDLQKGLRSQEIVGITLTLLKKHYEREQEHINFILNGFEDLSHDKLNQLWIILLQRCKSPQEAFSTFTQIVESELDGGECRLPTFMDPD